MENLNKIKFFRHHPRATLPIRGTAFSAGLDVSSIEDVIIKPWSSSVVALGLSVEIPAGIYLRIAPRSGLAMTLNLDVLGGVIDPDYSGQIKVILMNLGQNEIKISCGERCAQLIAEAYVHVSPVWADDFSQSQMMNNSVSPFPRGNSGFGSTGENL